MYSNSSSEPHVLPNKFEDIYVYHSHAYPIQSRGGVIASHFREMQKTTIAIDRGINIKYGEQLRECINQIPVVFSPYKQNNINAPITDLNDIISVNTYNTGILSLERNETIAVVPPMCDCPNNYKIQGVIPLQTVSHVKYSAALNEFFDWIRGVKQISKIIQGHLTYFPLALEMAYNMIKNNYLVQEMMSCIIVPDGKPISKIQFLYNIVTQQWMEPLFHTHGIFSEEGDLPDVIETTLRALNDTNSEYAALLNLANEFITDSDIKEAIERKLEAMVINILKIPQYYKMLTQYMSPLHIPVVGTIQTSYDDEYHIYPRKKMTLKQFGGTQ
jgi:hypothetical protein